MGAGGRAICCWAHRRHAVDRARNGATRQLSAVQQAPWFWSCPISCSREPAFAVGSGAGFCVRLHTTSPSPRFNNSSCTARVLPTTGRIPTQITSIGLSGGDLDLSTWRSVMVPGCYQPLSHHAGQDRDSIFQPPSAASPIPTAQVPLRQAESAARATLSLQHTRWPVSASEPPQLQPHSCRPVERATRAALNFAHPARGEGYAVEETGPAQAAAKRVEESQRKRSELPANGAWWTMRVGLLANFHFRLSGPDFPQRSRGPAGAI